MTLKHAKKHLELNEKKSVLALDFIYNNYTKGDLIKSALLLDDRIKTIDTAILESTRKTLSGLNINTQFIVTIYFKNDFIEVVNILEYITLLLKGV